MICLMLLLLDQKWPNLRVEVFDTRGRGVVATAEISRKQVICDYHGVYRQFNTKSAAEEFLHNAESTDYTFAVSTSSPLLTHLLLLT